MLKRDQKLNSEINNIFSKVEDKILTDEEKMFDVSKIKEVLSYSLIEEITKKENKYLYFEEVVAQFFKYLNVPYAETGKTRDGGIDGIITLQLSLLGNVQLGVQAKYTRIDSNDVDTFLSALKHAELQLGIIVCKESRKLEKYDLNSKIKAILFSRGILIREKAIEESININPIFIIIMDDMLDIVSSQIRNTIRMIYKK